MGANRARVRVREVIRAAFLCLAVGMSFAPRASAADPTRAIARCIAAERQPKSIVLGCADANANLINIRWTSWTATRATGTATYVYNDCEPYCAAGKEHSVKATFVLHGVVRTAKYGRLFTTVTVTTGRKSRDFAMPTSLLSD